MPTATNPTTGEKVAWINGQWTPVESTATNKQTGEKMALVGGQWQPLDYSDVGGTDFSFKEMASNVPSSAAKYAKDIYSVIRHPAKTGKAVGQLAGSALSGKAAQTIGGKVREAFTGEEAPQIDQMSEGLWQALNERYGSADAAKKTLMEDPVGVLADLAGGGAAMGTKGARRAAQMVEPLSAGHAGAKTAARGAAAPADPVKLYQRSAKFSTTLPEAKRQKIIQTALDHGVMPTAKGVVKVDNRVQVLSHTLDDLIEGATKAGEKIPVGRVFANLGELRKTKGGVKVEGAKDLQAIDKIAGEFHRSIKDKKFLTPDELQQFKTDAYKKIAWDAKRMKGSPIKEDTFKNLARGAKEALEDIIPDVQGVNRQIGDLKELQPHLARAAGRIENRNPIGLTTPINIGAGGGLGYAAGVPEIGVAAGVAATILNNPKMKARIAIALDRIKKNDKRWLEANRGTAEVRIAMDLAGRLTDQQTNQ